MPCPHLSLSERYHIESCFAVQLTLEVIANRLGRHVETIRNERNRNKHPYCAESAQREADQRKQASAANHPTKSTALWRQVEKRLQRDESPAQVVLARARYSAAHVCHQAIYDHIARDKQQGGTLHEHRRQPSRPRARKDGRAKSWAHQARPIRDRPLSAWRRKRVGHLELDTMAGKKRDQTRVLVAVDRLSWNVALRRVTGGDAERTLGAFKTMLAVHPYLPVRTVTTDRGQEFAALPQYLGGRHYVCDPYQPNQRGLCENTIGLLRQYFPKHQTLDTVSQADLDAVAYKLNHRPRARLNGRTPHQVISRLINAAKTRS